VIRHVQAQRPLTAAEGHNTILEKESTCPIPTCKKRTKKLKHHCWDYHLPFIFKDKVEETLENDPEFQQLRAEALTMLATWIYKRKSTPFDLVRFINNTPDFIPNNCNMMARCQDQMRNLTKAMNWFPPRNDVYTMYPVNHPSVLIQWRIWWHMANGHSLGDWDGIMCPKIDVIDHVYCLLL
jgi:hypothetical protein